MKMYSTKKALTLSVLSLAVCFAMLLGTTFAWFTDSVTSANNIIKSGNLNVEMYWADGTKAVPTERDGWTDASTGAIFDYDNWEPGYVQVRHIRIANEGSLSLKYKVMIVANGEVTDLADVIDVYYVDPAEQIADRTELTDNKKLGNLTTVLSNLGETGSGKLTAGAEDTVTLALKMQETVGNEYMNKSIGTDFSVLLVATQLAYENDSFDDQYDADADYAVSVKTAKQFADAIKSGEKLILENDIAITEAITVNGDAVVDLNGKTLDASGMTGEKLGRPFHLSEGSSLTINAVGAEVKLGGHGLVNVPAEVKNADITINGGSFVGETQSGTLIRLRNGNENVNIVLNDVVYNDTSASGYIVSTQGFEYTGAGTLTVNGGSYAANYGFQIYALTATLSGVEINTRGTAIEASGNDTYGFANVTAENCDITVAPGVQVVNAPAAGVAASHGGTLTIKNSTISGNMGAVYHVYNSGGHIVAEENDIDGAAADKVAKNDKPDAGSITIDGVSDKVVKVNSVEELSEVLANLTESVVIDAEGVTLDIGTAGVSVGSGMLAYNIPGNVTIKNLAVVGSFRGGNYLMYSGSSDQKIVFENCTFEPNGFRVMGMGMSGDEGCINSVVYNNCTFKGPVQTNFVANPNGVATFNNCTFTKHTTGNNYVMAMGGTHVFNGCTFDYTGVTQQDIGTVTTGSVNASNDSDNDYFTDVYLNDCTLINCGKRTYGSQSKIYG